MALWINFLWNNSFVNATQLPLLCRNSRTIALAESGYMAGWLAGRQNAGKFRIFKIHCSKLFAAFNAVTALLELYECI